MDFCIICTSTNELSKVLDLKKDCSNLFKDKHDYSYFIDNVIPQHLYELENSHPDAVYKSDLSDPYDSGDIDGFLDSCFNNGFCVVINWTGDDYKRIAKEWYWQKIELNKVLEEYQECSYILSYARFQEMHEELIDKALNNIPEDLLKKYCIENDSDSYETIGIKEVDNVIVENKDQVDIDTVENVTDKINVAELLKDCPQGMELDCAINDDVKFIKISSSSTYPIILRTKNGYEITLTKYGQVHNMEDSKCVIFPKGKTTWEGFVPPIKFKDGDILYIRATFDWVCIYKEDKDTKNIYKYAAINVSSDSTVLVYDEVSLCCKKDILKMRIATEKEKQKLFSMIKDYGYRWNSETKTLEKLIEPEFKVGDKIVNTLRKQTGCCGSEGIIAKITEDKYIFTDSSYISKKDQDGWELVPDKFDISTLIPFESRVLVRDTDSESWLPAVFGFFDECEETKENYNTVGGSFWKQCIPFENNEYLINTTKDCNSFYKTWE